MSIGDAVKRVLVGRKLASSQLGDTLLPKRIALPVFASDALSSVAYAPDEILLTLSLAGMAGFAFSWEIGLAVGFVMFIVVLSYRQVVHAYPSGGGDFEVATVNLGPNAGLTVASALLVDYVLTVAVSVSSGVQNVEALIPQIAGHEGWVAAGCIVLLTALNLRGARESGTLFAIPTYCFMVGVLGMIGWGLFQILVLDIPLRASTAGYEVVGDPFYLQMNAFAMVALLARAFSSGCAALTGVEAIANGVPAFRRPKSKNAAATLALLGTIAISMMLGIIALANLTGLKLIDPHGGSHFEVDGQRVDADLTAIGQLADMIFRDFPPGFYFVITATFVILFLAANTAFNGFPVLASILARSEYLPRALYTRGDRLAYSNGIIALATPAIILVLVFNASVTALIQLYVVGVFVSFTVSQLGMVRHWTRHLRVETDARARARMQRSRIINAVGLSCTGTVLVIVLVSKFVYGAYIAVIAMVAVFAVMKSIHRHYAKVIAETAPSPDDVRTLPSRVRAVVLVFDVSKPSMRALNFAKAIRPSSLACITVAAEEQETRAVLEAWEREDLDVPLTVLASPYREVTRPVLEYVNSLRSANPRDVVCVFIPELVVGHWWEQLLHNQSALILRARLFFMPGVMVTSVPYRLASSQAALDRAKRGDAQVAAWRRSGSGLVRAPSIEGEPPESKHADAGRR
ncbi:APC family permease [Propionicicella superfundia]|uniref:APC family permease n=1 Tax=Propionicicella superfundia TaxID=348582 RepID=UPI00040DEDA5|nr:APC family permease [Propionicicella superfundia]